MKTLKVGDSTIWGIADHVTKVSTGIYWCTTSSHGGVWLSIDRRLLMPAVLRKAAVGAWYEEDCDWCLVVTAFPECFKDDPQAVESAKVPLIPFFVLGFISVATLNNVVDINDGLHDKIVLLSKLMLGAGLVALGSGVRWRAIRAIGPRPMAMGMLAWVIVAGVALAAVKVTGL